MNTSKVPSILTILPKPDSPSKGWPWTEEHKPITNRDLPKISIITPNYNNAHYLEQTIRSVLLQNYPNLEYIIIDGGSTDNSINIIKKYEPWISHWVSEKDGGIYQAMNKGIKLSSGELIGNINSDDWYEKDTLTKIAECYRENKNTIIYGWLNIIKEETSISIMDNHHSDISKRMCQHPTWFVPKNIYEKYGTYNINYPIAADYEFACRITKKNISFTIIKSCLANHRIGGVSSNIFNATNEGLDIQLKNNYLSKKQYTEKKFKNFKFRLYQILNSIKSIISHNN